MMVKRFLCCALAGVLLLCLTAGCAEPVQSASSASSRRFEALMEEIFLDNVQVDSLTLRTLLAHPEDYGIEDYTPTLGYYYEPGEEAQEDMDSYASYVLRQLATILYQNLSEEQQRTYDVVKAYYELDLPFDDGLALYGGSLGPSAGIQAMLPVLLMEYPLEQKDDIEDYFLLLRDMDRYYSEILAWEEKKASEGLFMADFVVDAIIAQCESLIGVPEDCFMIAAFEERLAALDWLSAQEKKDYAARHQALICNEVAGAYQKLVDGLSALKGTGVNENGLAALPDGAEYYSRMVQLRCGTTRSMDELKTRLMNTVVNGLSAMDKLGEQNPSLWNQTDAGKPGNRTPEEMLADLEQRITDDFPAVTKSPYTVRAVASTMEEFLSPAFYIVPPLDEPTRNVIYINNRYTESGNLYQTLAHEGFPGHLYQSVYAATSPLPPVRHVLSCTGYSEGWGAYAEYYSYHFMDLDEDAARFLELNGIVTQAIYALLDIGVHYDGWTRASMFAFLTDFYGDDAQAFSDEIFESIVAEPGLYPPYAVGCIEILEMRENARQRLGSAFDVKEFHRVLLDVGEAPFSVVMRQVETWIEKKPVTTRYGRAA